MATRRVVSLTNDGLNIDSSGPYYASPIMPSWASIDQSFATMPWLVTETFHQQYVRLTDPPGLGNAYVFEILIGGVATGHSFTIADLETEGSVDAETVAPAGHEVVWRITPVGGPDASQIAQYNIVVDGVASGVAQYGGIPSGNISAMLGVFWPTTNYVSVLPYDADIVPSGSTLVEVYAKLKDAPGAGETRTLTLDNDGVPTAVALTISDAEIDGTWSGSHAIAREDFLSWLSTASGGAASTNLNILIKVVHDADGESYLNTLLGSLPDGATLYFPPVSLAPTVGQAAETDAEARAGGAMVLSNFIARAFDGPGEDAAWHFTLRKNGADTAIAASMAFGTPPDDRAEDIEDEVEFVEGDLYTVEVACTATPSAGNPCPIAFTQYALAEGGIIGPLVWVHWPRLVHDAEDIIVAPPAAPVPPPPPPVPPPEPGEPVPPPEEEGEYGPQSTITCE